MTGNQANVALVTRFVDGAINGSKVELVHEIRAPHDVMRAGSLGTHNDRDAYKTFL